MQVDIINAIMIYTLDKETENSLLRICLEWNNFHLKVIKFYELQYSTFVVIRSENVHSYVMGLP